MYICQSQSPSSSHLPTHLDAHPFVHFVCLFLFCKYKAWMDLVTVMQSEVSQKEKNICYILTHMCGI